MSDGQWAADITWTMSSWCQWTNEQLSNSWAMSSWYQLANEQLMSVDKWGPDLSWPISSWRQLANEQLTLFGQWSADIGRLLSSWQQQLANEQVAIVEQSAADISWPMRWVQHFQIEFDQRNVLRVFVIVSGPVGNPESSSVQSPQTNWGSPE